MPCGVEAQPNDGITHQRCAPQLFESWAVRYMDGTDGPSHITVCFAPSTEAHPHAGPNRRLFPEEAENSFPLDPATPPPDAEDAASDDEAIGELTAALGLATANGAEG